MLSHMLRGAAGASGAGGIQLVGRQVSNYAGTSSNITVSLTSLTGGIATKPSRGDLILVSFGVAASPSTIPTMTIPTGYTQVVNTSASSTYLSYFWTAYKVAGASADTSITIPGGTTSISNSGAVFVTVWRNVDPFSPMDTTALTNPVVGSVLCNPPPITPTTSGAVIVVCGMGAHNGGIQSYNCANLTDFYSTGANDSYDITLGGGYKYWTSGSFDPDQYTYSGSDSALFSNISISVALKPLSTTPPITYVGGYSEGFAGTSSSKTITFGGNLTGGIASSASMGDLIVTYFAIGDTSDKSLVVDNFTQVYDLYSSDTTSTNLYVGYRIAPNSSTSTIVLSSGTGASNAAGGTIGVQVWRYVDPTLLFDATSSATGGNSILCNPPSITPTETGSFIISGGAGSVATSAGSYSSSDLTGFRTSTGTDTYCSVLGLGYKEWTSGAFDPAAFTYSTSDSGSASWAAASLALMPYVPSTNLLTYIASATSSASTITVPSTVVAGDIMILCDFAQSAGGGVPSGFTQLASATDVGTNQRMSYKISNGTEAGTTLTGLTGSPVRKTLVVLRPSYTPTVTAGTWNSASNVEPSGSQTVTPFSTAPGIVIAAGGDSGGTAPDFSPQSPTFQTTISNGNLRVSFSIYNGSASTQTLTFSPTGIRTTLQSGFLAITSY